MDSAVRSKKQHFVPVFYLKAWESKKGCIHLFDIKANTTRTNVGLKGQCQKKLYYMNQHNEDVLQSIETDASVVCRQIRKSQKLPNPRPNHKPHVDLCMFILSQHARTPAQEEPIRQMYFEMLPRALEAMGPPPGKITIKQDHPQLEALRGAMHAFEFMDDLATHLITSRSGRFITSDNPSFFYNQLCQNLEDARAAVDSHGFQAFCPISPNHVVMLFDPMSYEITSETARSRNRSEGTEEDVWQLNRMQALAAIQNLYANDQKMLKEAPILVESVSKEREEKGSILEEYIPVEPEGKARIFAQHTPMLNLSLDLSFIRVKARAEKIPNRWKTNSYRHEPNRVPQMIREGKPVKIFADVNDPESYYLLADKE